MNAGQLSGAIDTGIIQFGVKNSGVLTVYFTGIRMGLICNCNGSVRFSPAEPANLQLLRLLTVILRRVIRQRAFVSACCRCRVR